MKRNIEQIINELQHDSKVQAMHRANVAKRQALRERRRALMLARMHKHDVIVVADHSSDREMKKAAIRQAIMAKYNSSTDAVFDYTDTLLNGQFNKEFNDLFWEVTNEIKEEEDKARRARIERMKARREEEEEEVYTLSNGEKTTDFLMWAQDRINARKAAIRDGIVNKFGGDVGKAIRFYSAVGKEDNQEFNSLFYEVVKELQEEQENDLHKWCENKAEKLARLTGEDKAAIIDRLERGLAA